MSYIVANLDKVKGENSFPAYEDVLKDLQDAAIERAKEIWEGYEFGGVYPGDKQFGICPLRMNEMAHDVSSTTLSGSYSFTRNFAAASAWRNLFDYSTRKDVLHAFAGFKITDEILRILQFRFEIGDRLFPIMDVQEAKDWGSFGIVFKVDKGNELIAEPETRVLFKCYPDSTGYQTVVPLGFELYKRKDLVITET